MIDAMRSSEPGRELGVLGRGDVPVAMAAPSSPVRRRAADGLDAAAAPAQPGRERPSASRSCSRARAHGAEIASEPTDYPYGERQYTAVDPGGHRWTFSESIADVDPAAWGGTSAGDDDTDWISVFSVPDEPDVTI